MTFARVVLGPLAAAAVAGRCPAAADAQWRAGPRVAVHPVSPSPQTMAPNASRIIGKVLKQAVWPPGVLRNTPPSVPRDQALYSLRVQILSAEPAESGVPSLARPGLVIDSYSADALAPDLVGHTIDAGVSLTGYVTSLWWWISRPPRVVDDAGR